MKTFTKVLLALSVVAVAAEPFYAHDEKTAETALTDLGLKPTKLGASSYSDYPFYTCVTSTYSTKFEAVAKDGRTVKGIFCNGPFFKGQGIEWQVR